jgi:hypothetical protein
MEAKMNGMRKFMHNIFWNENQIAFTFGSDIPIVTGEPPTSNKQTIISSLNLQKLNDFLAGHQFSLSSFTEADTLRPVEEEPPPPQIQLRASNDDLSSPIGKYLFSSGEEGQATTVIGFFHFVESGGTQPSGTGSSSEMSSMPENGKSDNDDHSGMGNPAKGPVPRIVNLINTRLKELKKQGVPIVAASPVWLCGSTQPQVPTPQGCPAIPPIPVGADQSCPSNPGRWPITLPGLSSKMQSTTGKGVTVFIFDTLPHQQQVAGAAQAANGNNQLLQDVSNNVIPRSHYFKLPDNLENPGLNPPKTGKDIYGRLVGFEMPDHGLFIAGIVRDLAPGATIECMRVLSDYCVGDLATLTKALELIHNRMSRLNPDANFAPGDLFHKPVVINMSLVIPPDDKEAKHLGFKPKLTKLLREHLLDPMNRLSELGAVFTASAGNEGDLRVGSKAMNPKRVRPFALFPSAFAYNVSPDLVPRVIPVGAVRRDETPASYSCYPGIKGIATFGGEVPDAIPPKPPKKPPTHGSPDCKTRAVDIDAVVGIYSSSTFPSLSIDDCDPTYPAPNPPNGWAYWVGTSFATPIISSVLARILELNGGVLASNADLLVAITNAVPASPVTWTNLDPNIDAAGSETGHMIQVVQCRPAEEDGEEEEEVDIEVINVVEEGKEVDIEVIDVVVKE